MQNKLLTLKLEDRNRVKDNLDTIMDKVYDLIADKYLDNEVDIEITNADIVRFGIEGIDQRTMWYNLDLVYGKMIESGYKVILFSDSDSEFIKVSV